MVDTGGLDITVRAHDLAGHQRLEHLRMIGFQRQRADHVLLMHGGRRGRSALGDAHDVGPRRYRARSDPEQEVGEGQIGEQLPIAHHPLQMVDGDAG